jgi:photosystem II stability/assembly factor-like uncharacterized protein
MKKLSVTILCTLLNHIILAQSWGVLPNSPTAGFRHDDLFFINPDTGWVVNVDGNIYRTTDGGNSFVSQLIQPATSFRCVGFADFNKGWAGNLGTGAWSPTTDTITLYVTIDGGNTWQAVTNINGPSPEGICGIHVLNDSVVFAVGRVGGPAYFMKTTNGGQSWTSTDLSASMLSAIDCYFFSPDTGIMVGSTPGLTWQDASALILYTTDGGVSWQPVYTGTEITQLCWKISFTSRMTGYVSVESGPNNDSIPVLKTMDGGLTWNKQVVLPGYIILQGVGFMNDSTGWTGGTTLNRSTTDGGITWSNFTVFSNFNRFRKVGNVAYASGNRIYKYSTTTGVGNEVKALDGLVLEQNYPNPFIEKTTINYSLPRNGKVTLRIYDFAGRFVTTLVDAKQVAGLHSVDVSLPYYFNTHFYYTLSFDDQFFLSRTMVMTEE